MSKIVQAVNSMIVSKDRITNVALGSDSDNEYFFLFDRKYIWSIKTSNSDYDDYLLFYYPKITDINLAINTPSFEWSSGDFIRYSSREIGTQEATQTFLELYSIIKEKQFGVDEILDEIINLNF